MALRFEDWQQRLWPIFFFPPTIITVNSGARINITLSEKTWRDKQITIWFGFTKRSFPRKTKKQGTLARHTQSICATLFGWAARPLCLFASLGRWKKKSFHAVVAFYSHPTPCRQMMKIPSEGWLRQTLKDNRGVRRGCEFFPFQWKALRKKEINAGGFRCRPFFPSI